MKNSADERRLINNELAARSLNQRVKKVIVEHTPDDEQEDLRVDFYCECSDTNCTERISLTLEEFETLHDSEAHFVLAKGHQTPIVEKLEAKADNFIVVKKYSL